MDDKSHIKTVSDDDAILDANFWKQRYQNEQIGWDMGRVSPPLKAYIDQLSDRAKSLSIMVAGAGNAYEVGYLHEQGFQNVTIFDIVTEPINNFGERYPSFPKKNLICADFFKLSPQEYQYDLAIEQTFLCAIDRDLRPDYVKKMHALLKPKGKLVGVLFDKEFPSNELPSGGSDAEYRALFAPYFDIEVMQPCINSHPARQGVELFIILKAKP